MKNKALALLLAFFLVLAFASTAILAQDKPSEKKETCAKADSGCCKKEMVCPVSGKPANKEIFTEYKGQKVYFCNNDCKAAFEKDPAKYEAKIKKCAEACKKECKESCDKACEKKCDKASDGCKEAMVCPVSGKPADKEIFAEYKGQKVYFCCNDCKAAFEKDPAKYEAKIKKCDEARKKECKKSCDKAGEKKECKESCKKEEKPAQK
jgi:YHS domain-containing protein